MAPCSKSRGGKAVKSIKTWSFILSSAFSLSTPNGVFCLSFNVTLSRARGYLQGECRPSQAAHRYRPSAARPTHHVLARGGETEPRIPLSRGLTTPAHSKWMTLCLQHLCRDTLGTWIGSGRGLTESPANSLLCCPPELGRPLLCPLLGHRGVCVPGINSPQAHT